MTYDARSIVIEGRRARVFGARSADLDAGEAVLRAHALDGEERARLPLLEEVLRRQAVVRAVAHPAEERDDERHVFVEHDGQRTFACVVVLASQLEEMLTEQTFVLEDASLQVVDEDRLDSASLVGAVRAWATRNFPAVEPRAWDVRPWAADLADLFALARIGPAPATGSLDRDVVPDPSIAA